MAGARLATAGLTMQFEGLTALDRVDLAVPAGQIHGLIGPNGAGKTTLFNCLTGFSTPTAGSITLDGDRIDGFASYEVSALGVARTFQNIRLFGSMTALENVLVGSHLHIPAGWREGKQPGEGGIRGALGRHRTTQAFARLPGTLPAAASALVEIGGALVRPRVIRQAERGAIESARGYLDSVGLAGRENEIAGSLPYGDQRRLELARALATRPHLLLLDEPTAGMNPLESRAVVDLIRRIRDEFETTVVLIEHQMRVVMGVCEAITVLDYGEKIAEGPPAVVQRDPKVIEAYLGSHGHHEGGEDGAS